MLTFVTTKVRNAEIFYGGTKDFGNQWQPNRIAFSFGYRINMHLINIAYHGLDKVDLRSGI